MWKKRLALALGLVAALWMGSDSAKPAEAGPGVRVYTPYGVYYGGYYRPYYYRPYYYYTSPVPAPYPYIYYAPGTIPYQTFYFPQYAVPYPYYYYW
jgi:hypothetical protein